MNAVWKKKMQNANEWKEVESLQVKAGVMWGNILPVWVTFSLWLIFLSADHKNKWLTKKEGRGQMIWISGMKWHLSERQSHMCSWANACPDVLIKKKISYSTVLEDEIYTVSQTYRLVSLHDFSRVHKIMLFKSSDFVQCSAALWWTERWIHVHVHKICDSQN